MIVKTNSFDLQIYIPRKQVELGFCRKIVECAPDERLVLLVEESEELLSPATVDAVAIIVAIFVASLSLSLSLVMDSEVKKCRFVVVGGLVVLWVTWESFCHN